MKYRIPGVRPHHSAEILASTSCTGDSTSPLTSPSRPSNTTAETRFSLVALHAGLSSSHRLRPQAPTRTPPARPGSVHPTRRTGGGGPCFGMPATLLLSVGDIMGSTSPEQSTSTHPYPGDGGERKLGMGFRVVFGPGASASSGAIIAVTGSPARPLSSPGRWNRLTQV